MTSHVYIEGKRFALDPKASIGKGGEADVYDLGDGRAVKVFKAPDHPDYQGLPDEQRGAEMRLEIHQRKLRAFPAGLPREVVGPVALATDRGGRYILGYAMPRIAGAEPLLRYSDPLYRHMAAPTSKVIMLFRELHRIVGSLHGAGIVVGDFNDLNVLITPEHHPRIIDSDSFQFGDFPCVVFTERFVDPLLCDPGAASPRLTKSYDPGADWYAYSVLLLQSLLFVGPYGGIYRPKDPSQRIPHGQRPLRRITIFHSEVQYPKPATRYSILPDELLHYFHLVFERDARGPFPRDLLDGIVLTTCPSCATEHARVACPVCFRRTARIPASVVVRGDVQCERLFSTRGVIVYAAIENEAAFSAEGALGAGRHELALVHHEEGAYLRADGAELFRGDIEPNLRIRVIGRRTFIGRDRELVVLSAGERPRRFPVDTDGSGPAFDTNGRHVYWADGGQLLRDAPSAWEPFGTESVGDILSNQTRIWVGPTFGLGFYRAGNLSRIFVFDAERRGINDELRLPILRGELIDALCLLDEARAWLMLALKDGGRVRHLCLVYSRSGKFEASAEAEPGDGSWLGTLRGKCAAGGILLAATDGGLVRVAVDAGAIHKTRDFPDTEGFVHEGCQLLVGRRGLYVVGLREVFVLRMKTT